jgi:hypothetical protein
MIVVTGCKRSGTSLWMQILIAAGFPHIGKAFSKNWEKSIFEANPHGFYESIFRRGIHFMNNPHPKNGSFVPFMQTQIHATKIFIPGLIRTDSSYLHRVIATIRHFKEYTYSLQRLDTMELDYIRSLPKEKTNNLKNVDLTLEELRELRKNPLHPVIEWWQDNYLLIRDFSTRRYPFHCVAYDKLLESPEEIVPKTLKWCFNGLPTDLRFFDEELHRESIFSVREAINLNIEEALNVIKPPSKTQARQKLPDLDFPFQDEFLEIFEEFYDSFYSKDAMLSSSFIEKLNDCHDVLEPFIKNEIQKHQLHVGKTLHERNISPQQFEQIPEIPEQINDEN